MDDSKRVTVRLTADAWQRLNDLATEDGITISDRVAAMVSLWMEDDKLAAQVAPRAKALAAETRRRRYDRSSRKSNAA